MTNPLDIFEIVQRVGYFIQIHKKREDHRYWHFDFRPKDLISCMQVNKTWRQALTPPLWRVYDEEEMAKLQVPATLLQANSQYFWYLDIGTPWPADTLRPTQLRQLAIRGQVLKTNLGLLHSNRLLSSLVLKLYDGTYYSEVQEALDSVTWLKTLQFHCGETLDPDHLAAFIFNNLGLKELLVSHIRGFERIVTSQPLIHLTSLHLNTQMDDNPGLVLLIRFCPNLEEIWFHGYDTCPFEAIATNIRECCPKASSIRCLDTFAVNFGEEVISEDELVTLIKSSHRLTHFEMPIFDLTARVCLAFLQPHWASLTMLRLYIYGTDALYTLSNAGKILGVCFNLKKVVLANECHDWQPLHCFGLLEVPWACKNLEAFTLRGVQYIPQPEEGYVVWDFVQAFEKDPGDLSDLVPMVLDANANVIRPANATDLACTTEYLSEAGDFVEYVPARTLGKHGWVVHEKLRKPEELALSSSNANTLVREIIQRTISLPKIRKVTINQYLYCKAASPELRQGHTFVLQED
ncbi:hypothetical protein BGZ74_009166 [Mortierella antarctica]|nr:hypothetical protein BGZ74_009166 [Mortierella antarctica]